MNYLKSVLTALKKKINITKVNHFSNIKYIMIKQNNEFSFKKIIFLLLSILIIVAACEKTIEKPMKIENYILTMLQIGEGVVSPSNGKHEFINNKHIEISAKPSQGWKFSHWNINTNSNDFSTISPINTIIMNENRKYIAVFVKLKSSKEMVEEIQKKLNKLGYNIDVDGSCGPETISTINKVEYSKKYDFKDGIDLEEYKSILLDIKLKEEFYKKNCPLEIKRLKSYIDSVGVFHICIVVKNITLKTVDGYEIKMTFTNRFGEACNYYTSNTNIFIGNSNQVIRPGNLTNGNNYWYIYGYDGITNVRTEITRAHYENGYVWKVNESNREILNFKVK